MMEPPAAARAYRAAVYLPATTAREAGGVGRDGLSEALVLPCPAACMQT